MWPTSYTRIARFAAIESRMTMGTLAVLAVSDAAAQEAVAALRQHGASDVKPRPLGGGRVLVRGSLPDEEITRQAVIALRAQGWAAAQRPADDDPHLLAW